MDKINNEIHYGYKNHAKVDNKHKFIEKGITTDASVHDSQALDDLLDEKDEGQNLWADSAYTGKDQGQGRACIWIYRAEHEKALCAIG